MGDQEVVQTTEPLLLNIKLTAQTLGIAVGAVERLVEDGTLPIEQIGNRRYIPAQSVREYVASIARRSA